MNLKFDNYFTNELPADSDKGLYSRQVENSCYSWVKPTEVTSPSLIAYSAETANLVGLSDEDCQTKDFCNIFSGNKLHDGMQPYAMCYGGHQFGNWAGQLGDGRAINLGDILLANKQHYCLQLKGSGMTPYSRSADGLAVLRSSVREFLCSEAMYHLGIPTTRALSLVNTGEQVMRDMFYDGNAAYEPGAIVCRVSRSFIRFGSFQIHTSRGNNELLKQLVDFTIKHLFPHIDSNSKTKYLEWFKEICKTTAEMVAGWMRVGFVHGVMNTDNMSILGETIDYGPYGWLEGYDLNWTPNTTDAKGRRYAYGNQPQIAHWNLGQLANALVPLFDDVEVLKDGLDVFAETFEFEWKKMMAAKFGFAEYKDKKDDEIVSTILNLLQEVETDMTIFFRRLAQINCENSDDGELSILDDAYYAKNKLSDDFKTKTRNTISQYKLRIQQDGISDEIRKEKMNKVNPKYVLRNYLAQLAIDKAEKGDYSLVNETLEVMRKPYDEQPQFEKFSEKRPEWAREKAGCSMLSCSS